MQFSSRPPSNVKRGYISPIHGISPHLYNYTLKKKKKTEIAIMCDVVPYDADSSPAALLLALLSVELGDMKRSPSLSSMVGVAC